MKTCRETWLQLLQIFAFVFVTGTASAQLKADFSVTPVTGCPPMVVSFKDSSKGNPVYWKWDLGNGTTSFLQDPIGTYFNPGTYSVKLVIKNAAGSTDSIIKNKIIIVNAPPLASFSAADTMGCYPLKVKFKDSSIAGSGTITSWQWDFGDGTLSSQQNPAHTYKAAGLFNVTLRVVNSNGCTHVLYKPAYIKTQDGVKADFNFSVQKNCSTPTTVNFTNLSAGTGILTYSWNFGDGNSSNKQNPANVYTDTGNYSVRLIATTTFGCSDTVTKANAITISSVTADFTTPSLICAGSAFVITNTSKPSTTSSRWQFGDGTISTDINPTKTYAAAGTYQVKLVNESGSCKDSVVKSLNVFARPVASFTATNTNGCTAPLTVNFTNTSTAASSVKWDFGDGTTSTANSPTHTYTSKGNFTVTLTATNTSGCSDIIVKSELVKIAPPGISRIKGLPVKGCLPYTIHPEAVIESNQTISSYRWDFGDGTTSTGILPSHTYTVAGIYDVKLIVTTTAGCKDSIVMKESVMVGKKLKTEFLADPLERCAMMPVQFTDLTKGDVHEWLWMFGDGKESTEQHPKHIYTDTGKMNVTLIVANYGCMDTLKKEKYVYIRPPVAGFDTAFKCNDPLTRNFKDISVLDKALGGISWSWDFGDNTTSSIQNPSHTYSAPGTYKVKLKVTNGNCWSERTKEVLVIKDNGRLTANDSARCLNTRITYNIANNNPANNKSYAWYFEGISGEAIVTTDLPVSVSFNSSGTRSSAVVTTNILNCRDTLYAAVPVKIFGTKAAFRANPPETCYGNTVTFIDTSITDGQHPIIEWRWDFGDGSSQTYTSGPFTHSYADVGSYNIKMVVKDSYGCRDSIYKSAAINITKSLARFIPSDTLICPNSSVTFTNSSEGVGLKYQWNFSDGTTSADESPVHKFKTEGTFKVRLVTVDKNGCTDSAFSTIAVYAAVANFEMSDSTSTCPPLLVDFTNTSTHFVKYTWDFGDAGTSELRDPSHMYTYAGTFFVKLTVMNNGGCTDSATRKVSIKGPSGVFNYNPLEACTPAKTDFAAVAKNTVKYIWDFNDGATIFTQVPASSHSFVVPGFYIPRLILEDSSGCRVAIPGKDTIKVFDVETHISASTRVVCDSGIVAFKDSSITNDVIATYLWNFGDGQSSDQRDPVHSYTDTGHYNITLVTTTKAGCIDTAHLPNYIKIPKAPDIRIIGDTAACQPATFTFQGEFLKTDTSTVTWKWNFGNGQTSDLQQPPLQLFTASGSFQVTVVATNSSGCTDTETRTVQVRPIPKVDAGRDTTICRYSTYKLNASGADSYVWKTDATLSCTNCSSPIAKPDTLITYYVTGETIFGCINSDSITIAVKQPIEMMISNGDTLCVGESARLKASGAESYQWSPAFGLNSTNIANPIARPDSSVTYRVIGNDDHNCFSDTGYVYLKVYPIPVVEIVNGTTVSMQVGSTVKLETKNSPDVTKWKWYPANTLSCASCIETLALPRENMTYSVVAINDGGCKAKDEITVNLICNNSNIYIPNTFSPNADGMNDLFYPRGTGVFSIRSFKIYNRWGQILFQKDNIPPNNASYGWDGTHNSEKMTPDVYVYTMEVMCDNNILFPIKGNISLIR